ncbi:MAG: YraN family protein [Kibdelosporangium sp.]
MTATVEMPNPQHELGRRGEVLAARYLQSKGLKLLSRNWWHKDGELDLVLADGGLVVFCEVKTRAGTGFGAPEEAVDERKARRIRKLAHAWLSEFRIPWCETRFDIVAILWEPSGPPRVRHIEGAF